MLARRHVAEIARAGVGRQRRADGRRYVIVAGRDVGDQRPQDVEGRAVADLLLPLHVHLDLIERHVARPFDDDLHVPRPGALRQLAQRLQLGELRLVAGVDERARAQAVAEAEGHVVAARNVAEVVEALVQRVLAVVADHPLRKQPAAAADDAGDALLCQRDVLAQDAAVDGHEVDALLRLVLDHVEQVLDGHVLRALQLRRDLVDGHRAHGQRTGLDDRLADGVDVAAGAQVHHGVGAEVDRHLELAQLRARCPTTARSCRCWRLSSRSRRCRCRWGSS